MTAITVTGYDGEPVTVPMRADASITRLYRRLVGRDIFADMKRLEQASESGMELDAQTLETFEDIAYVMAKHADPGGVPDTPDEWLERFAVFSIWQVLPQIIGLWRLNMETRIDVKKNQDPRSAR